MYVYSCQPRKCASRLAAGVNELNICTRTMYRCRVCFMPLYIFMQEKQKLQWENEALEKKLRETNLKLIDVAKAYPNVAALLNYNNSVNASATAVNSVSNMSTKVNSVKGNIHEPSDSEGN